MRMKSILAGVAALWMAAGCVSQSLGPSSAVTGSDADIAGVVRERLQSDPETARTVIGVSVKSGVVTLSGTVPALTVRGRAVALAEGVAGVRGVQDQMRAGY